MVYIVPSSKYPVHHATLSVRTPSFSVQRHHPTIVQGVPEVVFRTVCPNKYNLWQVALLSRIIFLNP